MNTTERKPCRLGLSCVTDDRGQVLMRTRRQWARLGTWLTCGRNVRVIVCETVQGDCYILTTTDGGAE